MTRICPIRHLRNEEGTGTKSRPAIVSGIVTRYWSAIGQFSLPLVTVPEVFARVSKAQYSNRFYSGD